MKKILVILCLNFYLTFFGQNKNISNIYPPIDTTKIAILSSKSISDYIFKKNCKEAKLDDNEIITVDLLLKKCIEKYNIESEKKYAKIILENPDLKPKKENFVIDIEKFKRQYIVVINSKGEKEVWLNCLCHTWEKDWRKELIVVKDGGNCYFNLKINLTKKKYYNFSVNGDA